MVPKQRGRRQRVFIPVAGLILFMVIACVPGNLLWHPTERKACGHLELVNGFIGLGDFEGAMKQSQTVLAGSPKTPPGDAALMAMGLISAHYANPKRDYKRAVGYFMRVEKDFPKSPLVEETRIWISVLQAYEKAKQVDLEIEEKMKGLRK